MENRDREVRTLSDDASTLLSPGDLHYRAYVGPPARYDLMGAAQFRLLVSLGLRESHRVLDFGCGSLRAGRMLIAYLQSGCYHGIDPNEWLIDEAVTRQLGADIIRIKQPRFASNADFKVPFRDFPFDFVLAQSIFSHTGIDVAGPLLAEFDEVLSNAGIIAATFSLRETNEPPGATGWVYPSCVKYRKEDVVKLARDVGLAITQIPFYHPTQSWFLMSKESSSLPPPELLTLLSGAIFNVKEFSKSLDMPQKSL